MKETVLMKTHLIFMALFWAVIPAHAAVITWGSATDIADLNDVSTDGTLTEAFNLTNTDTGSLTVNGVEFLNKTSILATPASNANFSTGEGGGNYGSLLDTLQYNLNVNTLTTISIGGGSLNTGTDYQVQLWFSDERNTSGIVMTFGDGEPVESTVTLNQNPGQYVIGSFTADAASQDITIISPTRGAHLNAYQLRELAVIPEPGTLSLVALSLLSLVGFKRFRATSHS